MAERSLMLALLPPLALAMPQPAAADAATIMIPICGSSAMVELPLPGQPSKRDCPGACHAAMCERQRIRKG